MILGDLMIFKTDLLYEESSASIRIPTAYQAQTVESEESWVEHCAGEGCNSSFTVRDQRNSRLRRLSLRLLLAAIRQHVGPQDSTRIHPRLPTGINRPSV